MLWAFWGRNIVFKGREDYFATPVPAVQLKRASTSPNSNITELLFSELLGRLGLRNIQPPIKQGAGFSTLDACGQFIYRLNL